MQEEIQHHTEIRLVYVMKASLLDIADGTWPLHPKLTIQEMGLPNG